jgi:predicted RNase H-like HicB family nuclease
MTRRFVAHFQRDEQWYVGWCDEVPGAFGQGLTLDEAREDLVEAIKLMLEVRAADDGPEPSVELITEVLTVAS